MKSTICVAEDREVCEPSLKLLLLSLSKHCSGTPVNVFYPTAKSGFLTWSKQCPRVYIQSHRLANGYGWNVKPEAIMYMLDQGFDEVIWIDSDIIVNKNILPVSAHLKGDILVATEDALGDERDDRNALRARLWGLPVGRVLPFGLNTGVLRVTKDHYCLLQQWWKLLQSSVYQDCQKREWRQRPPHMRGDQDVLTALLTSKDFSEIPLRILQRGKSILQFNGVYGYTVAERMRNLLGERPAFIHSFAGKPWSERWQLQLASGAREYIKKVYLDLSPYTLSAIQFKQAMQCDTKWMEPHYVLSRILRALGMGYPELVGLPIATFIDIIRIVISIQRRCRLKSLLSETGGPEAASKR